MNVVNYAIHSQEWYTFYSKRAELGHVYVQHQQWESEVDRDLIELPEGYFPLFWEDEPAVTKIVAKSDTCVTLLTIDGVKVSIYVSSSKKIPEDEVKRFKDKLIPIEDPSEGVLRVKFWYNTPTGPQVVTRHISAPSWDEIKDNYPIETQKHLTKLMTDFKPSEIEGHLILFYGLPGLGKSFSIRSLCEAWKSWANIDYVVDPEDFFGSAAYLMEILSSQHEGESIEYDDDGHPIITTKNDKWKLLILEDAGDFITADAKAKTGQALGRLLNVADGFIGQGLKILILITTNEEFEHLHGAVAREGRSSAIVSFKKFTAQEAKKWMNKHNQNWVPVETEYSLADLYALLKKKNFRGSNNLTKKSFGFSRIVEV
jgi:hypothetical protein